ncbi:O-antigen polymerase [uncultured Cyclobacterium sp.]|uniref:O-antigen polymerase n=1 Tax=uncultured Cyclobacterium sp. TaxID=453820 RepID=UPI0030EF61B1|tara:strand:- start:4475 stop:5797 length:1323 start_codon:yes stop_codon:yes gene_type:complete
MSIFYKLFFFISVLIIFVTLDLNIFNPVDCTFVILLFINSIALFSYARQPISIFRNIQLFFSFFLILAPFIQFKESIVFWGNTSFSQYDYFECNIILILILSSYCLFYYYFQNKLFISKFNKIFVDFIQTSNNINILKLVLLYFISIGCFFITFSNNGYSIMSLMFRGGEFSEMSSSITGPLWLISQYFVRPLPMILFLSYYIYKNRIDFHFIVFGFMAILTAFPLGMARFSIAALYIPLLILFFPILRKKFNFTITFVFGLLFLFPFMDTFRRYTSDTNLKFGLDFDMFKEGHFDTYQSILSVLKHDIITYGNQLFGVVFFWVPRSLWPNKPIGSGAFSAELSNLDFANISMNFFAEGYINFGYFGIFLFTILLSYLSAYFDIKFYKDKNSNRLFILWYYIFVGFTFYILRGDLLSSFAYLIGFTLGFLLVKKILIVKN